MCVCTYVYTYIHILKVSLWYVWYSIMFTLWSNQNIYVYVCKTRWIEWHRQQVCRETHCLASKFQIKKNREWYVCLLSVCRLMFIVTILLYHLCYIIFKGMLNGPLDCMHLFMQIRWRGMLIFAGSDRGNVHQCVVMYAKPHCWAKCIFTVVLLAGLHVLWWKWSLSPDACVYLRFCLCLCGMGHWGWCVTVWQGTVCV